MYMRGVFDLIKKDLYRYTGGGGFLKNYFFTPGFKYTVIMRLTNITKNSKMLFMLHILLKYKLMLMQHHYGIQIPYHTKIGKGFYIGHYGTIVVNGNAIIDDNVNISHGVTIGQANRGKRKGVATIGSCVYIGPGAKIIGNVNIGNNVAIGSNAVVTSDIPDNACVVGVPAKIISYLGSEGYINRKV